MSPGALCIICLIPIVGFSMRLVQTRLIITAGFLILGCAMLYSQNVTSDIDFRHLVMLRCAQATGIGLLFVPSSTMAYLTLPARLQGDATALFTMFRNVAGSVGISLSTAAITTRTQVHLQYLAGHLGATDPGYTGALAQTMTAVKNYTLTVGNAGQTASAYLYQQLQGQAALLAYMDVFLYGAIIAFLFVPFTFLFSPFKASGGAGAH